MTTESLVARINAAADADVNSLAAEVDSAVPLDSVTDLLGLDCGTYVTVRVTLGMVLEHRTRQGRPWASAILDGLEDARSEVELLVYPIPYRTCRDLLVRGAVLTVTGRLDRRDGGLQLDAHTIHPTGDPR